MIQKYIGHRPDLALLVLRLVVGATFFIHGLDKLTGDAGVAGVAGFLGSVGIPAAGIMAWVLTLVETLGGLALILGVATRLAGLLLGFVMVVAILTVKYKVGFLGGYELDLALLAANIALILQGGGQYALDAYLKKNQMGRDRVV